MFAGIGFSGSSRVPLRSNIFSGGSGKGYSAIGSTGRGKLFNGDTARQSPLLGTAQPSNRISGFYERVAELKSYQLLDITKLATGLFRDYLINFLIKDSQQIVTILDGDTGAQDEVKTQRINDILTKELKIIDFIQDHIDDSIFFGSYSSMLMSDIDDLGHKKFRFEELHDPVSVVTMKKKNHDTGVIEDLYLSRGDDGSIYEIPRDECFCLATSNLRLVNDLQEDFGKPKDHSYRPVDPFDPNQGPVIRRQVNREKVLKKESYQSGEPLFYSSILKVKELVVKELLVSLISLRDLSSPTLFGLAVDKGVPLEVANELCAKTQKMATNTNELASFLSAQFDAPGFIESTLTQNVKFFPDYNGTIANKNAILPLDKLSDKMLEIMQTLDQARQNVLAPLGIPSTIYDSTAGSKWAILQQSERANSRVASLMAGVKTSVVDLTCTLYRLLYGGELDPSLVKIHIFEKSTVEYNNQINQSESISSLIQSLSNVLQVSLQTLDAGGPLIDPTSFLTYVQTLIKDIDPSTTDMITPETINSYVELHNAKVAANREQIMGGGMM